MTSRQFQKGEVIFREWTPGSEMYEIQSGSVAIYANYGKENEQKLVELGPGRIFGELAAIDIEPRSATAVALSETETNVIGSDDLRAYFAQRPEKIVEIMRGISVRVRELTDEYLDVCDTIRDLDECRKTGAQQSKGLLAKIKRFAAQYAKTQQIIAQYDPTAFSVGFGACHFYY